MWRTLQMGEGAWLESWGSLASINIIQLGIKGLLYIMSRNNQTVFLGDHMFQTNRVADNLKRKK